MNTQISVHTHKPERKQLLTHLFQKWMGIAFPPPESVIHRQCVCVCVWRVLMVVVVIYRHLITNIVVVASLGMVGLSGYHALLSLTPPIHHSHSVSFRRIRKSYKRNGQNVWLSAIRQREVRLNNYFKQHQKGMHNLITSSKLWGPRCQCQSFKMK